MIAGRKNVQNVEVNDERGCGKPCKTWEHVIADYLNAKGLKHRVMMSILGLYDVLLDNNDYIYFIYLFT